MNDIVLGEEGHGAKELRSVVKMRKGDETKRVSVYYDRDDEPEDGLTWIKRSAERLVGDGWKAVKVKETLIWETPTQVYV